MEYVRKLGHLGYYEEALRRLFLCDNKSITGKSGISLHPASNRTRGEEGLMWMKYGAGGVVGWASFCGALNGAFAAVTLVSKNYKKIVTTSYYISMSGSSDYRLVRTPAALRYK